MQVIYKYTLPNLGDNVLMLERCYDVLSVQNREAQITLWIQLDPNAERVAQTFRVIPTGREFEPFSGQHLDSVQIGYFVWHVYEVSS